MESNAQALIVAGKYQAKKKLASGKNGIFMAGTEITTKTPCILKIYKTPEETPSFEGIKQELTMVRQMKEIHNPFFVRVLDLLEENGRWFAVFESVEGLSLVEVLSRHPSFLHKEEISRYFLKILDIFLEAKTADGRIPFFHLTPKNIILATERVCIVDFELPLLFNDTDIAFKNTTFLSEDEAIVQMGVVLYTLLTKEEPVGDVSTWKSPKDIHPMLGDHFLEILKKCVDPRSQNRFHSLEELREAFLHEPEEKTSNLEMQETKPFYLPIQKLWLWVKPTFKWGALFFLFFIMLIEVRKLFMPAPPLFNTHQTLLCAATTQGLQWLSPETGKDIATLPIPGKFTTLIPWPEGNRLIVADADSNLVFSMDPSFPKNASLLLSGMLLRAYSFNPTLHIFFASDGVNPLLYFVSPEVSENSTLPLSSPPVQMLLDQSGQKLYLALADGKVLAIDVLRKEILTTFSFPDVPKLAYADSDTIYLYFNNTQTLQLFSPTGEKLASIPYPLTPPISMYPLKSQEGFVVLSQDPKITFFQKNPTPNFVEGIPLKFTPAFFAFDSSSNKIYLASKSGELYTFPLDVPESPTLLARLDGLSALALWKP
jgi:serine/threonine protein kinase